MISALLAAGALIGCRGAAVPAPVAPAAAVPRVPPPAPGRATIVGLVADSTTGFPVVGARVYLSADTVVGVGPATPRAGLPVDTTGTDGGFALRDVPPGRHTLASAGLDHVPTRTVVIVRAGEVDTVVLRPRRRGTP